MIRLVLYHKVYRVRANKIDFETNHNALSQTLQEWEVYGRFVELIFDNFKVVTQLRLV